MRKRLEHTPEVGRSCEGSSAPATRKMPNVSMRTANSGSNGVIRYGMRIVADVVATGASAAR